MNQSVLSLTPGGRALNQLLGFDAAAVIVDNYTSSYVVISDAGKTVPPWTVSAVVQLGPGLSQARAQLQATTPAIPGPPVPLSQCTLTWTDTPLPADAGHLLQQVTTQQETVLGTIKANAGASASKQVSVPAGTLAIGYAVYGGTGLSTAASVTIQGDQTGVQYFLVASASRSNGVQSVGVDVTDTSVTVTLDQTTSASAAQIDVLAWPVVPTVTVRQNQGDLPIGVFLERSDGVSIDVDNPAANQYELGVSMFRATPAPWQAATNSATTRNAPGLATDFTIVAGVAGQKIYVHQVAINTNVGNNWEVSLWDGASAGGKKIADLFVSYATAVGAQLPAVWDGKGRPLTAGNALVGRQDTGAAGATIFGTYGYSQA